MSGALLALPDVLAATGGEALARGEGAARGVAIDSRELAPGELFVALDGPRARGVAFLAAAFAAGAWGALVPRDAVAGHEVRAALAAPLRGALVAVADTRRALGDLAALHRRRMPARVLGLTGSNGKTTTKELAAAILARRGPTHRTEGNRNSQEGLPLTLLRLGPEHRAAVLEMGADRPGGIARLAGIAAPHAGVVTSVGPAHLEGLGSIGGVRGAKGELLAALGRRGTAVACADDEASLAAFRERHGGEFVTFGFSPAADVRAEAAAYGPAGSAFTLRVPGWPPLAVRLALAGPHNVSNALAAVAAARALDPGIDPEETAAALAAARPVAMRLEVTVHERPRVTLVNDAYNANPSSMRAALAAVAAMRGGGRLLLVLGDMRELGPEAPAAHRALGAEAARLGPELLVAVGELADEVIAGARDAGGAAAAVAVPGAGEAAEAVAAAGLRDGDLLLLKGSRAVGLEQVARELAASGPLATPHEARVEGA